ncbi:MAG: C4-dicarboxylate ABC transporter substrate-binding protein, partial [Roseibium sp.]
MNIIKNAVLAAALLAGGATSATAADHEFKLHHFLGEKAPAHSKMLVPWARQVEENSGGKVSIELYPAMTLGGRPPELISQVRDGVVGLVWS